MQIIRENADPLLSVYHSVRTGHIVSVTTTSSSLLSSVPHIYNLINYPIVIHVSMGPAEYPDYSIITAIRQTGLILLQSESTQESQDMAVAAHALALKAGKAVLHFFSSSEGVAVPVEEPTLLERALDRAAARGFQAKSVCSDSLYTNGGPVASIRILTEPPASVEGSGILSPPSELAMHSSVVSSSGTSIADDKSGYTSISSACSMDMAVTTRPVTSGDVYRYTQTIFEVIKQVTGRSYSVFEYSGAKDADVALFIFGSTVNLFRTAIKNGGHHTKIGVVSARVYRPWFGTLVSEVIPKSVKKIAILEQIHRPTTRWGPLFLDFLACLRTEPGAPGAPSVVAHKLYYINADTVDQALRGVVQNLRTGNSIQNLAIGVQNAPKDVGRGANLEQPLLEKTAYMKILDQLFGQRLHVANSLNRPNAGVSPTVAASPEYGYGALLARLEKRNDFIRKVEKLAKSNVFATRSPNDWLLRWLLVASDEKKSGDIAEDIIMRLSTDGSSAAYELLEDKGLFLKESQWLVGSDAWAYDLGSSGVHHVIASGKNINMLIIDSQPCSESAVKDAARRKKDIGLYAMNFGSVYVASVAVYSSYTQVLLAMIEADRFDGPSIVMAYLPYSKEMDSPLVVLQETKRAVDLGYWPLYRWDPQGSDKGGINFTLDSERIKKELKDFLDRDNHLTQIIKRNPTFAANLSSSYGSEIRQQQKRDARDAFKKLIGGLSGPPLTILYASDGGNAEALAKQLERRGKARGLKTVTMVMEDYPVEDLGSEENIVLITSTAGQGEFPQNGRTFWDTVKSVTDLDLTSVRFSVFALGDSHYWPRKEDKVYYNKPGKDLDRKLTEFGGKHLVELGLGDDQDPDGYQTGYSEWEHRLWRALSVDNVDAILDEPPPITNEDIKITSNFLRGTIEEGLRDMSTMAISASDQQLTKFHGTYMQDDRDLRDERKAQGLEPAYAFMIRCRLPGGVATPRQWIKMDEISVAYGNKTMKLTTRQTFQVGDPGS